MYDDRNELKAQCRYLIVNKFVELW